VAADACAAATSPWKSGAHKPIKPMGHMKIGESKCLSNNVIDRSRSGGLTIIRGVIPYREYAAMFAR
jgi:hypothetical protein